MKRLFKGLLLIALLALLTMLVWTPIRGMLERFWGDRSMLPLLSQSTVSIAYGLDKKQWTVFEIPAGSDMVRILANGAVSRLWSPAAKEDVQYTIRYQVLDGKGRVLAQREYYQQSKITMYPDRGTGRYIPGYFFLAGYMQPLDGRIIMVNLNGLSGASRLRIRLVSGGPELEDFYIRAYVKARKPERIFRHLWKRLTDYQKERYAMGSVYPVDLLTEVEQKNILFNVWEPIGPMGIETKGYRTKELYIVRETERREMEEPVFPVGLLVEKGCRGIVPVPEQGGMVRLSFSGIDENKENKGGDVHLRWYGVTAFQRVSKKFRWNGLESSFEDRFEGGIIEIVPPEDVVVRAFLFEGAKEKEITPGILYTRAYLMNAGKDVEFEIAHEGSLPTPFRVDLRALFSREAQKGDKTIAGVTYRFVNASGAVIRTGTLAVNPAPSVYDRVAMVHRHDMGVSEPTPCYFLLDPEIRKIRFSSEMLLLVNGYNRPLSLVREVRVPGDYYMPVDRDDRQPSWFALRPLDYEKLLTGNRAILLAIQFRPPEDVPDILGGKYDWEDYHPEGKWRARRLLTPRDNTTLFRPESAGSLYRPIPSAVDLSVTFIAYPGIRTIQPRLIFTRYASAPESFHIMVDNQVHGKGQLIGMRGEMLLPVLDTKPHTLRIDYRGDARFYLSNLAPAGQTFLMRLGNRIDGEGLSFTYEKKTGAEETLSARLHLPGNIRTPAVLEVSIAGPAGKGSGPWTSWTALNRRFVVTPQGGESVPVFNAGDMILDRGQAMFIPLGSDLSPGIYSIRFILKGSREGYLVLYRLIPGISPEKKFILENPVRRQGTDG